jgi:hypothetical protein
MIGISKIAFRAVLIAGTLATNSARSQTPTSSPEGHVTQVFNDVKLLPAQAEAHPAALNDRVDENTGLRTGDDSRSELTFADLTITRLGANTIFSFNRAGRSIRLDSGAILLYAKKNSGGAEVSTKAVTVGVTGTTLIVDSTAKIGDSLIVLEGGALMTLKSHRDQASYIQGGQMLRVPTGAEKIPKPVNIRVEDLLRTHPLLANFPPLPSEDLMLAVAQGQNAPPPPPQTEGPVRTTKKRSQPKPQPQLQPTPVQGVPVTQTAPAPGPLSIVTGFPSGVVIYPQLQPRGSGRPGSVRNPPGGYTPKKPTPTPPPRKKRKPGSSPVG